MPDSFFTKKFPWEEPFGFPVEINSYVHNTATQGRELYSQTEGWNFKSKSILQTTTFLLCKQNNSEGLLASTRALKKQRSGNDALKWTWVDVQQLGGTAQWQKETLDVFFGHSAERKRLRDRLKRFNILPDAPLRRRLHACTVWIIGPGRGRMSGRSLKTAC